MDKNLEHIIEKRVENLIEALNKNNMEGYFVQNSKELLDKISDLCPKGQVVAAGGSVSLEESGVIKLLKSGVYEYLDRNKEGLTMEEKEYIQRKAFFADTFFTGTNAITEEGWLYNVDGNGNRVAAMIYGPKQVIVVVGINKIVKDVKAAIDRVESIATPANCLRLKLETPCAKVGYCMDCSSNSRICNDYTLIKRQRVKGRIKVIIVNENLGY